jgi:hypothetical protein
VAEPRRLSPVAPPLLYLDQNYLSGIAKRKPAFRELEPVLREAVASSVVAVPEGPAHRLESAARPDLRLLELVRELSNGRRLPDEPAPAERYACELFTGRRPDVQRLRERLVEWQLVAPPIRGGVRSDLRKPAKTPDYGRSSRRETSGVRVRP